MFLKVGKDTHTCTMFLLRCHSLINVTSPVQLDVSTACFSVDEKQYMFRFLNKNAFIVSEMNSEVKYNKTHL